MRLRLPNQREPEVTEPAHEPEPRDPAATASPHSAGHQLPASTRESRFGPLFRLARPQQWVKNLLVFAAPGAAGVLFERRVATASVIAFGSLCLVSSGNYMLNDVQDAMADRTHPMKRRRPVAAGAVRSPVAVAVGISVTSGGIALASADGWKVLTVVAVYVVLAVAYTYRLKQVEVLDIAAVATLFVIRAVAGGAAANVRLSNWFLVVASFGSLFVVASKREAEQRSLGVDAGLVRSTLKRYSNSYLGFVRSMSAATVMVAYSLWAFEKAGLSRSHIPWFELSIAPFAVAVLRYALLVDSGLGESPEDFLFRDRTLQVLGVIWIALFVSGTYLAS